MKKRHVLRNLGIGVVVVFLALVGIGVYGSTVLHTSASTVTLTTTASPSSTSSSQQQSTTASTTTTSSPPSTASSTSSSQVTTAMPSSTSSSPSSTTLQQTSSTSSSTVASSRPHSIQITQVAQDATDPPQVSYVFTIDATNQGQSSWSFDPYYFQLVANDSHVFNPGYSGGIVNNLGAVTLTTGQQAEGQIAFSLAANESPTSLEYNDSFGGVNVVIPVPQVTSWISEFDFPNATVQSSEGLASYVDVSASIPGSQLYFYTGEKVTVTLNLDYLGSNETGQPNIVYVTSIEAGSGIPLASISARLPWTLEGEIGSIVNYTIQLTFDAPAQSLTALNLTIVVSSSP